MKLHFLGRGAWGSAVGGLATRLGHTIRFIHHEQPEWPEDEKPDFIFIALPVQHIREMLLKLPPPGVPVLSLSKGLEIRSGYRVSQIISEVWGETRVGALSGPTFATEVAKGLPATCTIAAVEEELALQFQGLLHQSSFRIYRTSDLLGVELGGALKNVYAIAAGACSGLRFGQNSQAGLLTRCLAEMTRIGVDQGARAETFSGLSGIGDLILTASSDQSRNFRLGAMLAQGLSVEEILPKLGGVCEGVSTTRSVMLNSTIPESARPIITQIHAVLYESVPLHQAAKDLLGRAAKSE